MKTQLHQLFAYKKGTLHKIGNGDQEQHNMSNYILFIVLQVLFWFCVIQVLISSMAEPIKSFKVSKRSELIQF